MKLIVGLGNPGRKYVGTRHNVGFDVASALAAKHGQDKPRARFQGECVEARVGAEKVLLLCPQTYMNLSGASVLEARDFYKLENSDLLVICDDLQLPLGKLRVRAQGSAGGQKGLQNIIQRLGGDAVARLRVGIGAPPPGWDAADFVLSRFTADEQPEIDVAIQRAADAAVAWVAEGPTACMNKYNAG